MRCDDFETLLHPYVDGEFDAAERHEVDTHLAACAGCSKRVLFQRHFKQSMREAATGPASPMAPSDLRRGVLAGITREQRTRSTRKILAFSSTAAVLLVAGSAVWGLSPKARERFVNDAARRHARSLPSEINARAHDEVERWFGGKLDHRVAVPRFANATLSGARLSNVQERPAAYIRYVKTDEKNGADRVIGLFVFDDSTDDVGAQPLPAIEVEQQAGYNVALWREGEIVYELVTDLDEQDIKDLLKAQSKGATTIPLPSGAELSPAALRQ